MIKALINRIILIADNMPEHATARSRSRMASCKSIGNASASAGMQVKIS